MHYSQVSQNLKIEKIDPNTPETKRGLLTKQIKDDMKYHQTIAFSESNFL